MQASKVRRSRWKLSLFCATCESYPVTSKVRISQLEFDLPPQIYSFAKETTWKTQSFTTLLRALTEIKVEDRGWRRRRQIGRSKSVKEATVVAKPFPFKRFNYPAAWARFIKSAAFNLLGTAGRCNRNGQLRFLISLLSPDRPLRDPRGSMRQRPSKTPSSQTRGTSIDGGTFDGQPRTREPRNNTTINRHWHAKHRGTCSSAD